MAHAVRGCCSVLAIVSAVGHCMYVPVLAVVGCSTETLLDIQWNRVERPRINMKEGKPPVRSSSGHWSQSWPYVI